MYNPFGISSAQFNERAGMVEFTVSKSNLFDEGIPIVRILEIAKAQTIFIVERDSNFNLRFIKSNPNYETEIAEVNIRDFHNALKLFIAFAWSEKENAIFAGEYGKNRLKSAKSSKYPNMKFRIGKDGAIYQIGSKNVEVGFYRVKVGEEVIIESTAKELFDFQAEKIRMLIENCKKGDFFFESTLVQQIIVMLTTGYEVYARTRFLELEREGKIVNMEALYNQFVSEKYREQFKEEIRENANKQKKSELEVFIEKGYVNFQNWKSFKGAYNRGYNLKIGEISIPNEVLPEVQKFLKWRHKIIHSKGDHTIINSEEVPPAKPLFTNKDLAGKGVNVFQEFINKFHESTLDL